MKSKLLGAIVAGGLMLGATSGANASLLGQTVNLCSDLVFGGTVTANPASCGNNHGSAVVGAGIEFDVGFGRFIDLSDNTVSVIYEGSIRNFVLGP